MSILHNFAVKKGIIKMVGGNLKGVKADVERFEEECKNITDLEIVICPLKSDDAIANKKLHIKDQRAQNSNELRRCIQLKFEVDDLLSRFPKNFNELTNTREKWERNYMKLIKIQEKLEKRITVLENRREMMDSGIKKGKN